MRVVGHILAVQEQRFRLKTRTGEVFLLTLGRHAALDATELAAHQQAQTRVVVDYTGQPNLAGATAHAVRRAD